MNEAQTDHSALVQVESFKKQHINLYKEEESYLKHQIACKE